MATWIMIVFAHVGAMCSGNSNALTSVPGFQSQSACEAAGKAIERLATGTCKDITFACVKDR